MAWFVLSSTRFDFEQFERQKRLDNHPHHLLPKVAARLGTDVTQPEPGSGTRIDRLAARVVYGQPEHWALARRVYPRLRAGDAVYTAGPDSGIPLALLCGLRRKKVAFAINFADVVKPRIQMLGWVLALLLPRLLALVTTDHQAAAVRRGFGRRIAGVHVVEGQTDCTFFRPRDDPDDGGMANAPPLIASCGAERRDYALLAEALRDHEATVKVCFASPNLTDRTRYTMPDPVPDNFEFRRFEFAELRDLYQQADLVVVPLLENEYSAGLTTLFESIACGCPVVVTESPGIIQRLIEDDLVVGVPAGDPEALAAAVSAVVADPAAAAVRAERARRDILANYSSGAFLDRVSAVLSDLAGTENPVAPLSSLPSPPVDGDGSASRSA